MTPHLWITCLVLATALSAFSVGPASAQVGPAQKTAATSAMERGYAARAQGDFAGAESAFAEATQQTPTNAASWYMLGLVRSFRQNFTGALDALKQAATLAPSDLDIALAQARVQAFAGRFEEADTGVNRVITSLPNSREAWTLKGRIASYQSRFADARAAYDRAASLGPADADLLLAYGDLARAESNPDEARSYYERAAALDPASVEIRQRLSAPAPAQRPLWLLSFSGGKSWISRSPAPDWAAADLTLLRRLGERAQMTVGVSYARRFFQDDTMVRLGFGGSLSDAYAANIEIGFTPQDDVLPEAQAIGNLTARLTRGAGAFGPTVAALDTQLRRYATGTVKTLSPGLDQYFGGETLVVSARLANTWDATDRHLTGWSVAAAWRAQDRLTLRLSYGNAPESERGLVADTKTIAGGLGIQLSDSIVWRIDLARESRDGSYRRTELTSGLNVSF